MLVFYALCDRLNDKNTNRCVIDELFENGKRRLKTL